ncbi:hypothetical protein IHE45_15G073700 [Dioscorea alata]|uniref:Uncharacterized protein n=1 Tax=Dioscorea alata TaxID=55571 RepID=A0ACB7UM37_DIOAL|nr:hypothetical protein IHE45_15G073700 [Dioscorea alata]
MLQQHGDHQMQLNGHPAGQNPPRQIIAGNIGGFHLPQGHAPGLIQQEGDHHHHHHHHHPPPRAPIAWVPRYELVQQEGPFPGPMRYIPRLGIVFPSSFTGASRFNIVQEPFIAAQQPSLAAPAGVSSRRGRGRGRPPGSRGRSQVDSGGHQPSQAAPAEGSSRRGRGRPPGSRGLSHGRNQVDSGDQLPSQAALSAGSPRRGRGRPPAAGRPTRGRTDQVDSGEETGVGRHPQRGRGRPRGCPKRRGGTDEDGSPGGKHAKHDFGEPSSAA